MLWRREFKRLQLLLEEGGWLLLYGRRKTGKTFMARLLVDWEVYATVTRSNSVVVEEKGSDIYTSSAEDALKNITTLLRRGGIAVLDEFQRLREDSWQLLSLAHPEGVLVLVASSLGVVEKVFSRRSPLLGLVAPVRIDLVSLSDAIASLAPRLGARRAVLWSVLLREPWLTGMPRTGSGEPWKWVASNAQLLYTIAQSLIGEVFSEEERKLTRLYDAVLRLLGAGVWDSRSLAAILYERGLIGHPSPSIVTGVLDKLSAMGLVAKTRLWMTRGRRVYYRHQSPLLGIVYGLAEKHGVDEYPVPTGYLGYSSLILYSRELQFSLAELLAERYDGVASYTILPRGHGDVDIVVLDRGAKKAIAAYEVKLGACSRGDYAKAVDRAWAVGAEKPGIICLRGLRDPPPAGVEALDAESLVGIAVENTRKTIRAKQW